MKRRTFVQASAAMLATPYLARSAFAQSGFDWKSQSGKTINVAMARHPWQEAIEPLIPEFEELTGISVRLSKLPERQYLTKVVADLTSGVFGSDVFMTEYYDAPTYQKNNWTADLRGYLDASGDAPDYQWSDFFPAARDVAAIGGRYIDRVAITAEAQSLVYRTDVLDEMGIDVPATFDDLAAVAQSIAEERLMAGITLRGGASNWWPFYGVLRSYGGEYVNVGEQITSAIDSEQSRAALEMYARLADHAPQGVTSYDWDQINTAMLSGQAAMFLDSSVIYSRLQDPELSAVVGKVGIAPFVEGPAGRRGHSHFWTLSLSGSAPEPDAGWMFLRWATSKDIQGRIALNGVLSPRASAWQVEGLSDVYPQAFLDAVATSLETAVISPANEKFFELMDPLRAQIQETMLDNVTADQAIAAVGEQWEQILT